MRARGVTGASDWQEAPNKRLKITQAPAPGPLQRSGRASSACSMKRGTWGLTLGVSLHHSELKGFFFANNFTQLYYCIETQRWEGTHSGSHSKIVTVLGLESQFGAKKQRGFQI